MALKSEKISDIHQKLIEINGLIKKEWDENSKLNNTKDAAQFAGCYKALNAIIRIFHEEEKQRDYRDDRDYVFSRLLESFLWFADYYEMGQEDALDWAKRLVGIR